VVATDSASAPCLALADGVRPTRAGTFVSDTFDDEHFPDNFYHGLIVFLDRVRGRGVIRSSHGREIPFQFPFVAVVGAPLGGRMPGIQLIKQGDSVGFDVGWTAGGLRVTTIRPAAQDTRSE